MNYQTERLIDELKSSNNILLTELDILREKNCDLKSQLTTRDNSEKELRVATFNEQISTLNKTINK